jgi:hypothetical protein
MMNTGRQKTMVNAASITNQAPWIFLPLNRVGSAVPESPVKLLKHASDLAAEDKARAAAENN